MAIRGTTCSRCGWVKKDGKCMCGVHNSIGFNRKKKPNSESEKMLHTYRWQKKRAYILRRDGGFCQRCWHIHKRLISCNLEAHHIKNRIDYPELAWDENNLICICADCNKYYRGQDELDFDWKPPVEEVNL